MLITLTKVKREYLINHQENIFYLELRNKKPAIKTYPWKLEATEPMIIGIWSAFYNKDPDIYYQLFRNKLTQKTLDRIVRNWVN